MRYCGVWKRITIARLFLQLAVGQDLSIYDTCYLQAALVSGLPLATNDKKLRAAESCGVRTIEP